MLLMAIVISPRYILEFGKNSWLFGGPLIYFMYKSFHCKIDLLVKPDPLPYQQWIFYWHNGLVAD
jgi:hypothetical protein